MTTVMLTWPVHVNCKLDTLEIDGFVSEQRLSELVCVCVCVCVCVGGLGIPSTSPSTSVFTVEHVPYVVVYTLCS